MSAVGAWTGPYLAAALLLVAAGLAKLRRPAGTAIALRRGSPVSSCGCFGGRNKTDNADSPPTLSHAVLNLAAAATAGWAALHAHAGAVIVLRRQPLAGIPLVLLIGAGAYLAYLVMGDLPKTLAAGGAP